MPRRRTLTRSDTKLRLLCLLCLCVAQPLVADDIEVLVGPNQGAEAPKVLLLVASSFPVEEVQSIASDLLNRLPEATEVWLAQGAESPFINVSIDNPKFSEAIAKAADRDTPIPFLLDAALRGLRRESKLFLGVSAMDASGDSAWQKSCRQTVHILLLADESRLYGDLLSRSTAEVPTACRGRRDLAEGDLLVDLDLGYCAAHLVEQLTNEDLRLDVPGTQGAILHVLELGDSSAALRSLASLGQGRHTTRDDIDAIIHRIRSHVDTAHSETAMFLGPTPVASDFQAFSHLDQLLLGVFRPRDRPRWDGNLKRYALRPGSGEIDDATGKSAIDTTTGRFASGARSFWSPAPDGDDTTEGGAASRMPRADLRRMYTDVWGSTELGLRLRDNPLSSDNLSVTNAVLDVRDPSVAERSDHIDWIRGRDVDDEDGDGDHSENRHPIGDVLHSRPAMIPYGVSAKEPDLMAFFGTNSGVLHAISVAEGEEVFSFLPGEMLPLQNILRANPQGMPHPYGIDGSPTVWYDDVDGDGIKASDAGDFARVYVGLRRGGRSYYALDVTKRDDPILMWTIHGGSASELGDYRELGQTWSRPVKTRIAVADRDQPSDVLIFSAGYDDEQDQAVSRSVDTMGRGMYLVDAVTGKPLWSGGKAQAQTWHADIPGMDYSFPGGVSVLDINSDGLADLWFAADTGGRLWRFDIHNGAAAENLITAQIIADLSGAPENNRRFYSAPSVALAAGRSGMELVVAIGSGFRPSPLSTQTDDGVFLLREPLYRLGTERSDVLGGDDLQKVTPQEFSAVSSTLPLDADKRPVQATAARGWFLDLQHPGEKVLASPLIVNGRVLVTTYTPGTPSRSCEPPRGVNRTYSLDLRTGFGPVPQVLHTTSLVDQPVLLFPPLLSLPRAGEAGDSGGSTGDDHDSEGNRVLNSCSGDQTLSLRLNTEGSDAFVWCNETQRSFWVKDR